MNFAKQGQPSGTGNSDFYLEKLERGLEQVHEGLGIIKTMEELEAIEKDEDTYGPFDSVADLMEALNA